MTVSHISVSSAGLTKNDLSDPLKMSFSFSTALKAKYPYDGEQIAQIEQFVNDSIAGIKHNKALALCEDRFIQEIMGFMGDKCCDINPEFCPTGPTSPSTNVASLYITDTIPIRYCTDSVIEKLTDPQAGNVLYYAKYIDNDDLDPHFFQILRLSGGPTITQIYSGREVHISSDQNAPILHIKHNNTGTAGRPDRQRRECEWSDITEFNYRCNCAIPCIITNLHDSGYRDHIYGDSTGGCHFTIEWYYKIRMEFYHHQMRCSNCDQISDTFYICPHMIRCRGCTRRYRTLNEYGCVYCWMDDMEQQLDRIETFATQYGILDAIEGRDTKFKLSREDHPYNAGISIGKALSTIHPDDLKRVVAAIYSTLDPIRSNPRNSRSSLIQ